MTRPLKCHPRRNTSSTVTWSITRELLILTMCLDSIPNKCQLHVSWWAASSMKKDIMAGNHPRNFMCFSRHSSLPTWWQRIPKKTRRRPCWRSESEESNLISNKDSVKEWLSNDGKAIIIKTVFQEQINKGQLLTMKEVRGRMHADLYLWIKVVNSGGTLMTLQWLKGNLVQGQNYPPRKRSFADEVLSRILSSRDECFNILVKRFN